MRTADWQSGPPYRSGRVPYANHPNKQKLKSRCLSPANSRFFTDCYLYTGMVTTTATHQ